MTAAQHYCTEHNSKFYRNEKVDASGQVSVWFSHKKADGTGFCIEKSEGERGLEPVRQERLGELVSLSSQQKMLACNAMNNAVALAVGGKIQIDQIGDYYKRIFSELTGTIA